MRTPGPPPLISTSHSHHARDMQYLDGAHLPARRHGGPQRRPPSVNTRGRTTTRATCNTQGGALIAAYPSPRAERAAPRTPKQGRGGGRVASGPSTGGIAADRSSHPSYTYRNLPAARGRRRPSSVGRPAPSYNSTLPALPSVIDPPPQETSTTVASRPSPLPPASPSCVAASISATSPTPASAPGAASPSDGTCGGGGTAPSADAIRGLLQ